MADLPEISEFPKRVHRKEYQQLLLNGRTFWYGRIGEWKGRHLGAGIYEVRWVPDEPFTPTPKAPTP